MFSVKNNVILIVTLLFLAAAFSISFGATGPVDQFAGAKERTGLVTAKGEPLTLLGSEVKVGDAAPPFTVVGNDMKPVDFSSYKGKAVIISAVPSLDTPVCNRETHRFNEEAPKLGKDTVILTISMDLPFAQKRWCGAEGVNKVVTLSDYRYASFGLAWGVLIRQTHLLSRAVFIIDREGVIRYIQRVKDISNEPDYDDVLSALKKLT